MSHFEVPVVRVGTIEKHPNADTLGLTQVFAYPVIIKLGELRPGDLACYVPVDAVVPATPEWAFLTPAETVVVIDPATGVETKVQRPRPQREERIKAKRLRKIFSMGLLRPLPAGLVASEGDDLAERLGIKKYDPPPPAAFGGDNAAAPFADVPDGVSRYIPVYEVENLRRFPGVFAEGEPVTVSEKIHGTSFRAVHDGTRLHVGSHRTWKREEARNMYWAAALAAKLDETLRRAPRHVLYGEVFGVGVQDLQYGLRERQLRAFDVFDMANGRFLDHEDAVRFAREAGVDFVPELHRGPFSAAVLELSSGKTTLGGAHIREGVVIKPLRERIADVLAEEMSASSARDVDELAVEKRVRGRVILKFVSEAYLLREGGTEFH